MDSSNIALICVAGLFALLLVADLVLAVVVILKMRGRGEHVMMRTGSDRAFIRGWKHPDLRPYMIAWTLTGVLTCLATCILTALIGAV